MSVTLLPFFWYLIVAFAPDAAPPDTADLALPSSTGDASTDVTVLDLALLRDQLRNAGADLSSDERVRIEAWYAGDFNDWDADLAERHLQANAAGLDAAALLARGEARIRFPVQEALLDPRASVTLFGLIGLQQVTARAGRDGQPALHPSADGPSAQAALAVQILNAQGDLKRLAAAIFAVELATDFRALETFATISEQPLPLQTLETLLSDRDTFRQVILAEYHQRRLLLLAILRGDAIDWLDPQELQALRTLSKAGLFKKNAALGLLANAYRDVLARWEALGAAASLPVEAVNTPYRIPAEAPSFMDLALSFNPGGTYFMRRVGGLLPSPEFLEARRRLALWWVRSARIQLALNGYVASASGAMPDTLAVLSAQFPELVVADPFAPAGAPLGYDAETGFLRSVGLDGEAEPASALEASVAPSQLLDRWEAPVRVLAFPKSSAE
ncbi:MAG: hypothetical protein ACFBZ8_08015 [Opitutales bacterium]